jgi:hypothetical protein
VLPIDVGQGDEALGYITEIGNDDGRIPLRSLIGQRKRRSVSFNDPSYSKQWHLNSPSGLDINVIPVWEKGYTGMGVVVTIVRSAYFLIHSVLLKLVALILWVMVMRVLMHVHVNVMFANVRLFHVQS